MAGSSKFRTSLGAVAVLAAIAAGGYLFQQHSGRARPAAAMAAAAPAIPVTTALAEARDMPLFVRGIGTVQAYNQAVIKTRVEGAIVKVAFQEGSDVKQGDTLFQIDPRPFQASFDEASAAKARNEAQLVGAELDLDRFEKTSSEGFESIQRRDRQRAVVGALKQEIARDEALIERARLELAYANIRAPFDGRTGTRLVDIGNYVQAAQATALVSLTQIKPIFVTFTVPQDVNDEVRQRQAAGNLPVIAYGSNDTELARGELSVIDNQIDVATGTLRLKATFANLDERLWPGQFVSVRLQTAMRARAVTVPQRVVVQASTGYFVYVIRPDGTAERRTIGLSGVQDGIAVIDRGLAAGETVAVDGQFRLKDGVRTRAAGPRSPADAKG
jgi:membrane fusion protein, multidrug efflux system